jgi:hypothetical protein
MEIARKNRIMKRGNSSILEVAHLTKRYGEVIPVNDITCQIIGVRVILATEEI